MIFCAIPLYSLFQLRVFEEEFGHERPMPGERTPSQIVSQDAGHSTISLILAISPDLLLSTKLKPTSANEAQIASESEAVLKENQQAMTLDETLVRRRKKITPEACKFFLDIKAEYGKCAVVYHAVIYHSKIMHII